MKKITSLDMKDFSSKYPGLSELLKLYVGTDKILYCDEEYLTEEELKIKLCGECKKGEKCLSDSWSSYPDVRTVRRKYEGQKASGLDDSGHIEYKKCETWAERERRGKLNRIGIPPLFYNCNFENYIAKNENAGKALDACKKFVESIIAEEETKGLFMSGPFGTGKTHLAAASIIKLFDAKITGLNFGVTPKLLALTRKTFNSDDNYDYIGQASKAGVLVLDDVGAEKISEWVREQLFLLINERYENQLPTIITTNASMSELEDRIGGASVSRIWGMCKGFVLDGEDHRKKR